MTSNPLFSPRPAAKIAEGDFVVTEAAVTFIEALNTRLLTSVASIVGISDDYDDPQWNDRYIVMIEIHPLFRGELDPRLDDFDHDRDRLHKMELFSGEKFCWDETGYDRRLDHHEFGYTHFLLSQSSVDLALCLDAACQFFPKSDHSRNQELELLKAEA